MRKKRKFAFASQTSDAFLVSYHETVASVERIAAGKRSEQRFAKSLVHSFLLLAFWDTWRCRSGSEPLSKQWRDYQTQKASAAGANFFREKLLPVFHQLGYQGENAVSDEMVGQIFDQLLCSYSFVLVQAAHLDSAITPSILGYLIEETIDGRHERGSYYTPAKIVAFMCREVLKTYLQTACPQEAPTSLSKFVETSEVACLNQPSAVLDALRQVKVCDPACGAGAFLLGMLEKLAQLRTALEGEQVAPHERKLDIIANNLFGLDVDSETLDVARTSLWLTMLASCPPEVPLITPASLTCNLMVADTLVDTLPFHGEGDAHDRGFDIILMNPPYVAANRIPGGQRQAFRESVQRLRSRYGFSGDLYVHFLYRALQLLSETGVLYALTPGTYLTNTTKTHLRRELLRHRLHLLMPLDSGWFPAIVYPTVLGLQKRQPEAGHTLRYVRRESIFTTDEFAAEAGLEIAQTEYAQAYNAMFYEPTARNRRLFGTLLSAQGKVKVGQHCCIPLERVAPALDTGIDSGNVRHKLFFQEILPDKKVYRLLQGGQLVRYGVWWEQPGARYRYVDLDYLPDGNAKGIGRGGKPSGRSEYWRFRGPVENHHVSERILLRQTEDEPFAGYIEQDDEHVYTDNTIHTLLLTAEGQQLGLSYAYLLALLNSSSVRIIYQALAQERGRTLAQVKVGLVNLLPIALPSDREQRELEALVTEIQGLYRMGFPLSKEPAAHVAVLQRTIDERVASLYRAVLRDEQT